MDAEVTASLVAAFASLVIAGITYLQQQRERERSEKLQRELAERSDKLQRELASLEDEQQRQLTLLQDELARRGRQEEARQAREQLVARFREPLAHAAYNLQSRLWNVLRGDFLQKFLATDAAREQAYARENTLFVIAQYFAWTEIIRKEVQFIDLGKQEATRDLAHLQDEITKLWGSHAGDFGPQLRIWAGEQRALGEMLIVEGPRGPECMGYGAFLQMLHASPSPLIAQLQSDIAALNPLPRLVETRLRLIQHALIDLLNFLDPEGIRFPPGARTKVTDALEREETHHAEDAKEKREVVETSAQPAAPSVPSSASSA